MKDALDADLSDCRTNPGDGCADVGVGGQGSVQVLQCAECAACGVGEQLAAGTLVLMEFPLEIWTEIVVVSPSSSSSRWK